MAKIPKRRRRGQLARKPKTLAQYQALPPRSQATIENLAHVLTRMREGFSLKHASAEYGIAPRTVVKLGGTALRKTNSGRYAAKASDNFLRVFKVPVANSEPIEVAVRGSRAGSVIAKRAIAQGEYLATGDDSKLRQLSKGKLLDASGNEVPFLTDLDELERQGDLGFLSYESIYARRG
jgi:hypothetical protein